MTEHVARLSSLSALERAVAAVAAARRPRVARWWNRPLPLPRYLFEAVVLVGALAVVNLVWLPGRPGFDGLEPNPFWAPVLLLAARYGFRAALLTALLASGVQLTLLGVAIEQQLPAWQDLAGWRYAHSAVLFILVGNTLGLLVDRQRVRSARLRQQLVELEESRGVLLREGAELRAMNHELAARVVSARVSLPALCEYARRLDEPGPDRALATLSELGAEVLRTRRCAVYVVAGRGLVLHSVNGERVRRGARRALPLELEAALLDERRTVTLHDLAARGLPRDLYLGAPLCAGAGGPVRAVLAVEELDFVRYNPTTVRLFEVIVEWGTLVLGRSAEPAAREEPSARRSEAASTPHARPHTMERGEER